jgi:hypothetical protein
MILLPCLNVATRYKCALCQADDNKCRYSTPQDKSEVSLNVQLNSLQLTDTDRSQKPVRSVPSIASGSTTNQPATPAEGIAPNLQPTHAEKERRIRKALAIIETLCRHASHKLGGDDLDAVLKEVQELRDAIDDLERQA